MGIGTNSLAPTGSWTGQVSIPAAATSAGEKIVTTLITAGYGGPIDKASISISAYDTAGASRAAILLASKRSSASAWAASDFTTHPVYVPAGMPYDAQGVREIDQLAWRAVSGAAVTAQVLVSW